MNLEDGFFDDINMVKCAHCGSQWTHHDEVVVTDRSEDATDGLQVLFTGDERCSVNNDLRHLNPSGRRHGIAISIWCESCAVASDETTYLPDYGPRTLLTIMQHKGVTYIHVEKQDRPLSQVTPNFAAKRTLKDLHRCLKD